MNATIGKRVRRHVDHTHDQRAFSKLHSPRPNLPFKYRTHPAILTPCVSVGRTLLSAAVNSDVDLNLVFRPESSPAPENQRQQRRTRVPPPNNPRCTIHS